MASGWSKKDGVQISGLEHLKQSVFDILMTPIGTRVLRRDYGSDVPGLIDQPMNPQTVIRVFSAAAKAIDKWEPRFDLKYINISAATPGNMEISDLKGIWYPDWPKTENAREVELVL